MEVLKEYISFEENIKGSRFLSELFPCSSQAQARELIKAQKEKYADATHVVHAFVVGPAGEVMGMSDDGEPSGTAGRPALDVLRGRQCTNTLLTITRWFGGTLLGTGGLVKAYGNGAKQVLAAAEEDGLFEELVEKTSFSLSCPYDAYKTIKMLITSDSFHTSDIQEDFSTDISIKGTIYAAEKESLAARILDTSNGKIRIF